jgi:flagellar biosynthesis GTPase FlhF
LKVVLEFLKKRWKYVITALIALSVGAAVGPSQNQIDSANAKVDEIKKQLSAKEETVASLETKNKDLQAKVDEAAPWFKMQDEQKQKEAEEKRLAEEKAKQEAEAAAKAKAEADAKAAAEAEQSQQQITVDKVKEIIEYYSIGENDKLNNISFENGEIKATIVLAPNELFSAKDVAVNRFSQLSDELLNHEGWQILTVTYANVGSISMNRNEKETNEYGDYFPTLEIEERLK